MKQKKVFNIPTKKKDDPPLKGFKDFLEEHGILNCPSAIYICDESGFPLTVRYLQLLAASL